MFDVVRVELLCSLVRPPTATACMPRFTLGRGHERGRGPGASSISPPNRCHASPAASGFHLPSGAVLVAPLARACAVGDSRTPNIELGEPHRPLQSFPAFTHRHWGPTWRDGWQAPYQRLASGAVVFANLEASGAGDKPSRSNAPMMEWAILVDVHGGLTGRNVNSQQRRARNSLFTVTSLLRLSLKPRSL